MDVNIKTIMNNETGEFPIRDLGWFMQVATHGVFNSIFFVDFSSLAPGTKIVRFTFEHELEMRILDPKTGLVEIMMDHWTESKKGRITECRVSLKTEKEIVLPESNFKILGLVMLELLRKSDKEGYVVLGSGVDLSIDFEDGSFGTFSLDENILIS